MARLSARFSRFFKPSRRSHSTVRSTSLKSKISKPIVAGEDDTHTLLASSYHTHTHSHSSSVYTISDSELHSLEQEKLSRRLADDIDDIIASYAHIPPARTLDPFSNACSSDAVTSAPSIPTTPSPSHPSPTPSSVYSCPVSSPASSPPSSPPTFMKARLERFRDTPPPAPGWDKVNFGRETGLFGPDRFAAAARNEGDGVFERDEGRAGRRKDWRVEFARRGELGRSGYAVL